MRYIVEPIGYKKGVKYTRQQWEKNHKPTCSVYPCEAWKDIHWHFNTCKHGVWTDIKLCKTCDKWTIRRMNAKPNNTNLDKE